MADNNKNPRRTIWLSETEPLSHYDIWLSKNQHLNSDGEPVSTSGVLRDCDYIFKVWDCNNWHPIVGLNSTALNKIDTVWGTTYTDSNNIQHGDYEEFNVPLFTKPGGSPSELFNGGSVGYVILNYVSNHYWQLILLHIYNISSNIENPYTLQPASSDNLGGIKANALTSYSNSEIVYGYIEDRDNAYKHHIALKGGDIYAAIAGYLDNASHDSDSVLPDFHLWLAETNKTGGIRAKTFNVSDTSSFREVGFLNTTTNNDTYGRLFVNSQDIVNAGILLATNLTIGGIKANTFNSNDTEELVEVKFLNSSNPDEENYGLLYVNPIEVTTNTFNDDETISDLLWKAFKNSPSIKKGWTSPSLSSLASKPRFSIYGDNDLTHNGGKFLRLKTSKDMESLTPPLGDENYDDTYNFVEWADIKLYLGIEGGTAIEIENDCINLKYNPNNFNVINLDNLLTLKPATTYSLGGIKVGSGLSIDNEGFLSVAQITTNPINITKGKGIEITSDSSLNKIISQNIKENRETDTLQEGNSITIIGTNDGIRIKIDLRTDQQDNILKEYEYCDLSAYSNAEYNFESIPNFTNPIYLKIAFKGAINITVASEINYIGDYTSMTSNLCLVTILFGIIKFEEIHTVSSQP